MADNPKITFPDGSSVDIADPDNIAPVYADLITEFREVDGIIYISFASFIIDGDGDGGKKARVISRLRISRERAAIIYGLLGNTIGNQERPNESLN
jgi:hypothetical protein